MLSRTADHLFWMSRYTERAENTARMLDVHVQNGMRPQSREAFEQGWRAVLGISELQQSFDQRHDVITQKNIIDFMVRDPANPSSIASCLKQARENARAVRGALTTEAWEIQNSTWLKMDAYLKTDALERNPVEFFDWVKHRSHLSRGVTIGTMLMDDAFHFIRIGTFLERADNTARLIDVKFHGLTDESDPDAEVNMDANGSKGAADFYYWAAVLRSVSAFEIYRKVYRDVITPQRVADLLILRIDMPRSLMACMDQVLYNLKQVRNDASAETERFAGKLHADLNFSSLEEIEEEGLHNYLTRFFERVFELGNRISRDFLVPLAN